MAADATPVELGVDALNRLLDQEVMHALISPDGQVPGAADMAMRCAEFWAVIDIVRTSTGRVFRSRVDAETDLFDAASGGGFGIRQALREAVLDLLHPVGVAPHAAAEGEPPEASAAAGGRSLDAGTVSQVAERLGNYVYILVDPRDSRPFYVGKGVGLRMMSHGLEALDANGDTDGMKVKRINEIRAAGREHEIWIVRYGLTRSEYTAVEAAVIDTLGSFPIVASATPYRPLELRQELTNMRREDAKGKGMILLDRLVDEIAAPPLTTSTPLLMITLGAWNDEELDIAGGRTRYGNGFKREWYEPAARDANIHEVERSTTAWWKLSRRSVEARRIHHAVAVHRGVTRGLFQIDPTSWTTANGRTGFVGLPVLSGDLYDEVIGAHGHRVTAKSRGNQNPIAYWPLA